MWLQMHFQYLVLLLFLTEGLLTFSCFTCKQNLSTFISTASKFAQLQYLWKTRDSGAVSALTWSLASYTCASKSKTPVQGRIRGRRAAAHKGLSPCCPLS